MNNVGKIAYAQRVIAGLMSLMLGKKSTVEWGQVASCRDNGTICLPRPKTGDAGEIALLTRLAVHEGGHDKHTDFECFADLDGNVKALMNALEDPRIEREQVKMFPGAALILNRGLEDSIRAVDSSLDPNNPEHSADLVVVNVLLKGFRELVPHEGMKEAADSLVAKGDKILGDAGLAAVEQAIGRLAGCVSTADTVALAKGLWMALQPPEPQPEPNQQDQQPSNEGGDVGDENQDQQDGDGEADANSQQQQGGHDDSGDDESPPSSDGQPDSVPPESKDDGDAAQGETSQKDAGGNPGPDGTGSDESRSDPSGQPGESEPNAAEGSGEAEGHSPEAGSSQGQSNGPETGDDGQGSESGNQSGDGNASAGTHNQETPASGDGENTQDPQKGEGDQGKPRESGKLDLNSASGTDLGSLLAHAYELKYGKPDIDAPDQAGAAQETTATDDFTQMVAAALAQAADDGESLEKALELIEVALEAGDASEQSASSEQESQPAVLAAGGGNATGNTIPLDIAARLSGSVSRLVRIFTKELQDKRRRQVKLGTAGGQVASNRVWRLKSMGDTNVFRVTASVVGIDAAATFFLDRSGSMDTCIVEAAYAALSCSQALERISKVKTSIEMFPGYADTGDNTVTLQAFGQSARQVARRVNDVNANGGTPLAEALQEAIPRLLAQRVKKRIAFLVTDGIPNDRERAMAEIRKAEKAGVEFVGIGIGEWGKAIELLTPYSVCINDASELPDAFEKLFRGNIALKLAA